MDQFRAFRFAILTGGAASRKEWTDKARQAETLGYSTLLIDDHLYDPFAPLTALVSAADATTSLRVGSLVFGNDFRHPVILAKEAATLDLLSDGRLELGLGTGYWHADYEQSGIPLQSPGTRVSRFEEAVQIVKGVFADAAFTYEGNYYTIHNLNGLPKPVQKPYPPLLLGGGSKRMLSIAAREANIVGVNVRTTAEGGLDFSSITPEATDQKIAWVRAVAGERFQDLELNMLVFVIVTDQRRQAAEQTLREFEMSTDEASIDGMLASPAFLFGTVEQIIEDLQFRRQRFGLSYIAVGDYIQADVMERFAPVVARLAGT
ncbi:MAG TPA: TIGR03621 family F420-dependent LLM class oxidoreductase [Anaerolineales bacterium]|nr:TIGR03621 family F420-dependent LLM class oxidoreductase [Anaerolineales bacterium]